MTHDTYLKMVDGLVTLFGDLQRPNPNPTATGQVMVRHAIETVLQNHGIQANIHDVTIPGESTEFIDNNKAFQEILAAGEKVGIQQKEFVTTRGNAVMATERMAEEILTLRVKVSNRDAELKLLRQQPEKQLVPVAGLDDAYSSLRRVLDAAYEQAATGKGAERHANALSFENQPMQTISGLLGDNHGLLFQAVKKIQESTRLPHYTRRERELLGAINYIAGAIIFDVNTSAPEDDSHD